MKTLAIFPNMSSYEKTDELFKKLNIGVWEHFIDIFLWIIDFDLSIFF